MTNGLWTFYAADKRIAFEKVFLNVLDGFGQPMKTIEPVTTLLPVVRRFGKVQIGDDPSVEYKKQPGP